jgi:hypothetical protein
MFEMIAFFFSEVWNYRKNRFIAVGGIAALFVGIMMALVRVQGLPDLLVKSVAFCTGFFVVATLTMMVYYAAKFIILGVAWLIRVSIAQVRGNRLSAVEVSSGGATVLGDLRPFPQQEDVKKSDQYRTNYK